MVSCELFLSFSVALESSPRRFAQGALLGIALVGCASPDPEGGAGEGFQVPAKNTAHAVAAIIRSEHDYRFVAAEKELRRLEGYVERNLPVPSGRQTLEKIRDLLAEAGERADQMQVRLSALNQSLRPSEGDALDEDALFRSDIMDLERQISELSNLFFLLRLQGAYAQQQLHITFRAKMEVLVEKINGKSSALCEDGISYQDLKGFIASLEAVRRLFLMLGADPNSIERLLKVLRKLELKHRPPVKERHV